MTFTSPATPSENRRDDVYLTSHSKREQTMVTLLYQPFHARTDYGDFTSHFMREQTMVTLL